MSLPANVTVAARLDRLPESRTIRRLVILLSLGACFEYYDLFLTAYIAPGFYQSGIFTATTRGFLVFQGIAAFIAAFFAGLFVGTLLSRASDRFGRRTMFSISLLWYSACTFIMAFQNTAETINFWRFLAGVGVGLELVTIDTYVSELVPKDRRGAAFALNQFFTFLAVPFVALVSWLLVPVRIAGLDGWRWVVLIGSSGAVFVWFIRRTIPESPRWLEQQGRTAEAHKIMDQIEDSVRGETHRELPTPQLLEGEREQSAGSWMELWKPPYRRRTILLIVFQLLQTLGYYGFANWAPTFLISKGLATTKSLEYTTLIALANPIAPLIGMAFADKFERKWQIAWSAILLALFGLLFAQQKTAAGVILFGILITLSSSWLSVSFHTYQAELYPTRIRAQAVGFVYSFSRLGAIANSFVIAFLLRKYGTSGVFLTIALGMAIIFVVIGAWGPRTSRLRLEQIAR